MYSKVYRIGEFSYTIAHISVLYKIWRQDMETMFACIVGFSGTANSNMLKIFREPRELTPYSTTQTLTAVVKPCTLPTMS